MANEVQIYSVAEIQSIGKAMARSKLFGFKTEDEAFALMMIASAEGKHPATIAQDYDIIQGRPALKSMSVLARFQHAGGSIQWHVRTDLEATATLSHKQGGDVKVTWDKARAQKAKLWDKPNWQTFPGQMLSARVVSEGVRACFPACLNGMYVAEEVQDFEPRKAPAGLDPKNEIKPEPETTTEDLEALRATILDITTKGLPEAVAAVKADIDKAGNDVEALLRVKGGVERSVAKLHKPAPVEVFQDPPKDQEGGASDEAVFVQSVEEKSGAKAAFWVVIFSNGVEATTFSSTVADIARSAQAEGLPIKAEIETKGKYTNLLALEIA